MNKQDLLREMEEEFGFLPLWVLSVPDAILDTFWDISKWILKNTTVPQFTSCNETAW
jgi:predicted RNA-binding protein (virulence factor B family)